MYYNNYWGTHVEGQGSEVIETYGDLHTQIMAPKRSNVGLYMMVACWKARFDD